MSLEEIIWFIAALNLSEIKLGIFANVKKKIDILLKKRKQFLKKKIYALQGSFLAEFQDFFQMYFFSLFCVTRKTKQMNK